MNLSYDTLLVANRGEIARRIIRSARALGLRTVAVYSDADAGTAHVREADDAIRLGGANPADSYLSIDKVLEAAAVTGAGAVHPGYGFLSESPAFAEQVEAAGMAFVGPTVEQLRAFGEKHTAREAARRVGVPLVPGTALLADALDAAVQAEAIGFPVIVKAVGGGGGIGLQVCNTPDEVREAFDRVNRLSGQHFSSTGVFLERYVTAARHVEVQVFGDGAGNVVTLGTRDCSLQRRNQKVIEEAPAPALSPEVLEQLLESSRALAESVAYRSAGTVEFVYDQQRDEVSFLEMNTRLQVEHPVTEAITGVDLVGWMLRVAGGDAEFVAPLAANPPKLSGHAIEARVYAEDAAHDYRPSPGTVTAASFPSTARVDTWIEAGTEVSPSYDPLLAKVIVAADTRDAALDALADALGGSEVFGVTTNLGQLREAVHLPDFRAAQQNTHTLDGVRGLARRIDVERPGTSTTVQDLPGRTGYWEVGIPPSGPMDAHSFSQANALVGNPADAAALECTLEGPRLRFADAARVVVTGAGAPVTLDGEAVPMWSVLEVPAGGVLDVAAPTDTGLRTYIAIAGGIASPEYLGSGSTFSLGGFGGPFGRDLRVGDVLTVGTAQTVAPGPEAPAIALTHEWTIGVTPGPQAGLEYFTEDDLQQLYRARWRVSAHANRTGIRLQGPKPQWARTDGGEAGLHPSNLHDNPYSVGALNVSGDTPILLGPDGPSLGGFVCPVTVIVAERWKLGQLRPGDTVRFTPVDDAEAIARRRGELTTPITAVEADVPLDFGTLAHVAASDARPAMSIQRAGDDNVLIEYGEMLLDLGIRLRVHALTEALTRSGTAGIIDATPGVRSLHLHFDPEVISQSDLVRALLRLDEAIGSSAELEVPSRQIRLPLSFDDPSIIEAIDRYRSGVRSEAPWLPSNTEFIRRVNGLDDVADVRRTMFEAEYLVLGLGDVYLGAPLAVPIDPRHRMVTTKYNPARTWTPSDAVGIGGQYLCVYGMESPGGYQLTGRTLPIWSTYRFSAPFAEGKPWLFRFFDRITWEPVTPAELTEIREAARAGRYVPQITEGTFNLARYQAMLTEQAESIAAVESTRATAFAAEREAWRAAGEFDRDVEPPVERAPEQIDLPEGATLITAPMAGNVWRVEVGPGTEIAEGTTVAILEAMKLELPVRVPAGGRILDILVEPGMPVQQGTPLAVIGAAA